MSKRVSRNKVLINPNNLYLSFSVGVIGEWGYFNFIDHNRGHAYSIEMESMREMGSSPKEGGTSTLCTLCNLQITHYKQVGLMRPRFEKFYHRAT